MDGPLSLLEKKTCRASTYVNLWTNISVSNIMYIKDVVCTKSRKNDSPPPSSVWAYPRFRKVGVSWRQNVWTSFMDSPLVLWLKLVIEEVTQKWNGKTKFGWIEATVLNVIFRFRCWRKTGKTLNPFTSRARWVDLSVFIKMLVVLQK